MFKWEVWAETKAKSNSECVWDIWTDVGSWPTWDHELEWSNLNGPFKIGTKGKLKPKGWPASEFCIISVEEGKSHSDKTVMPLTKIIFNHELKQLDNNTTYIRHHVTVSGLLAPLLWLTMRRTLKKGLPKAVQALARLAESKMEEQVRPATNK